ncbi:MAG: transcriptional regulator [Sedimenticola sp.]|jgi:DNA-binding transcriptional regulator GbsR (MarR family)|nr:MAG: transcriptional regulator [Sedimenticola sp.]
MKQNTEHAVEEFVERLGLVAQADGLPRIAGRIMGFLVIHGGPYSFSELAEHLKVSRGSISSNTRLLESLGVIERITRPGERQDYFQMRPHPYMELVRGLQSRLNKARQVVADAQRKLPEDWSDAQTRLAELGDFYSRLVDSTEMMVSSGKPAKFK